MRPHSGAISSCRPAGSRSSRIHAGLMVDLDWPRPARPHSIPICFWSSVDALSLRDPGEIALARSPSGNAAGHRIHHSNRSADYNALCVRCRSSTSYSALIIAPARMSFRPQGSARKFPAPRSLWSAQFGPFVGGGKDFLPKRRDRAVENSDEPETRPLDKCCRSTGHGSGAPASARAPMVKTQPGFYRMMLGDFEITALNDGVVAYGRRLEANLTDLSVRLRRMG